MERTPEPELMDDDAQARAYSEADFEAPHDDFVVQLKEAFPGLADEGVALDLGCGPADISVRFAKAFPGRTVHGVDGAESMLRYGRARIEREGLAERVLLYRCLLPDDAPPAPAYDFVFSNSLLHHLHDPRVMWRAVRAAAGEGAGVFVMDLMRPADRATAERFVEEYAAGEPEVLQKDFFHSLLAAFTLDEVRAQLDEAGLGHFTVQATSDRHLVVHGRV
jgi:SAM-dependent methyltransferase